MHLALEICDDYYGPLRLSGGVAAGSAVAGSVAARHRVADGVEVDDLSVAGSSESTAEAGSSSNSKGDEPSIWEDRGIFQSLFLPPPMRSTARGRGDREWGRTMEL